MLGSASGQVNGNSQYRKPLAIIAFCARAGGGVLGLWRTGRVSFASLLRQPHPVQQDDIAWVGANIVPVCIDF